MTSDAEQREHLWFSLPVRCWCGEQHVLGLDDGDEWSSADDANAPVIDERIEATCEGCYECGGRGWKVTCPDDMCHGEDECIHGDPPTPCPACNPSGQNIDGLFE